MTQRIVIPVENNLGINAQVAQHFGQAPYFALVELDAKQIVKVDIEKNTSTATLKQHRLTPHPQACLQRLPEPATH
jgi:predicted Fe-Mo cluster-binding NifX family protein